MTFTAAGEDILSAWMAETAFVVWALTPQPWTWKEEALLRFDLPLNLRGNKYNGFHAPLSQIRAAAKATARESPVAN